MNNRFRMVGEDLLGDEIYLSERFTRGQALVDLIMLSAYSDRTFRVRGNIVELKRGQVAKSLRDLSLRWQWSVNTVSKFLKELQEYGYIDTQKTSVNQIITVKKYLIINTQNDTQNDTPIIYNIDIKEEKEKEKEDTIVSEKDWRSDYDIYKSLIENAVGKLLVDEAYKKQMEGLYINIDYKRTIIACSIYWEQQEQWETYKRKRNLKTPNFVSAIKNGFKINKVYKTKFASENYGYPQSVEDVKKEDVHDRLIFFDFWIEKAAPKVCDGFTDVGRPKTQSEYQHLINHTVGGAKALCYVVLVFNRDGWDEYYDERGFMFTYANYIKKNGLYKD